MIISAQRATYGRFLVVVADVGAAVGEALVEGDGALNGIDVLGENFQDRLVTQDRAAAFGERRENQLGPVGRSMTEELLSNSKLHGC